MVTATDLFCGAGGSSTGLVAAGIEVKTAINHWKLAIETHNTNHPTTDHDCVDIRTVHPSAYPRTDMAWFSPECTNHSIARGKKRKGANQMSLWDGNQVDPAEERSRATMREVVEFTEQHRYEIVIVENVVDIRHWQHYESWLTAMTNLGYDHKVLYLNSQFFGVPQSRDRFYAVFWKQGNKAPNLEFRPPAWCTKCEASVDAVQAWKKPDFRWGRYGTNRQYVYKCPICASIVHPGITPAWAAIDWTLPAQVIGERAHALKPKTLQRIRAGIRKFARPVIVDTSMTHADSSGKFKSVDEPLATQTTRQSFGVAVPPFSVSVNHSSDRLRSAENPLDTVMPHARPALVIPPFMAIMKNSSSPDGSYTLPPRLLDEPLTTIVASTSQHALILPPFMMSYYSRNDAQSSADAPLPTIPTENRHSLIVPPFFAMLRNHMDSVSLDEPAPAIVASAFHHALITPPFLSSYYGTTQSSTLNQAIPTISTVDKHALIIPELVDADIESILMASKFRMLEPHELKLGMSFPDSYIVLGNKREQVRQIGNAVTCHVAEWIGRRCRESLE